MSEYYDMIASGRKDKSPEQKWIEEAQKQNREAYATGNYNTWMSQLERGVPVGIEEGYNANMRNKGLDNVWGTIKELGDKEFPTVDGKYEELSPYTHHDNAIISASPSSYIPPTHKNRHPWDTDMVTNYELNRAKFMSGNPDMVPQEVKGFNDNRLFNGLGMFDATKWMIPIARWWENR